MYVLFSKDSVHRSQCRFLVTALVRLVVWRDKSERFKFQNSKLS